MIRSLLPFASAALAAAVLFVVLTARHDAAQRRRQIAHTRRVLAELYAGHPDAAAYSDVDDRAEQSRSREPVAIAEMIDDVVIDITAAQVAAQRRGALARRSAAARSVGGGR